MVPEEVSRVVPQLRVAEELLVEVEGQLLHMVPLLDRLPPVDARVEGRASELPEIACRVPDVLEGDQRRLVESLQCELPVEQLPGKDELLGELVHLPSRGEPALQDLLHYDSVAHEGDVEPVKEEAEPAGHVGERLEGPLRVVQDVVGDRELPERLLVQVAYRLRDVRAHEGEQVAEGLRPQQPLPLRVDFRPPPVGAKGGREVDEDLRQR